MSEFLLKKGSKQKQYFANIRYLCVPNHARIKIIYGLLDLLISYILI